MNAFDYSERINLIGEVLSLSWFHVVHTLFLNDNKKNSLFQNVKMLLYFYYSLEMTQTPKLTAKVLLENFPSLFVHFETLIYK